VQQLLIFGCGDTGRRVAGLALAQQLPVAGVVRSATSSQILQQTGIEAFLIDLDAPSTDTGLPSRGALIIYMVPPPDHGEDDPRLEQTLRGLEQTGLPARILYISTTGVYGDCQGRWIDENTPLAPATPRARRRVATENLLREWCALHGVAWIILRVPAIYGPGRLPIERLRARLPVPQPNASGYSNRIHVYDLARICFKAMTDAPDNSLYNVSDGNPVSFTDYLSLLAELAGLPAPSLVTMQDAESHIDPGMMSFLRESKRVRNDKLLRELRLTLHYPDARSGILASLAADSSV
jgi:nucleoside-diphosphate-sugar epimerase